MNSRVVLLRKKIHLERFRYKVQLITVLHLCLGITTILFLMLRKSIFISAACSASSGVTVFLMFLSTMNAISSVSCWGINVYILDRMQKKLNLTDERFSRLSIPKKTAADSVPCATIAGICSHATKINFAAASFMCFSRVLSLTFLFMYKTHVVGSSIYGIPINPSVIMEFFSSCLYFVSLVGASVVYFVGRRMRNERSSFFSDNPVDYPLRKITLLLVGMSILSVELLIRITDLFGMSSSSFPIANVLAVLGLSTFALGHYYGLCITDTRLKALEKDVDIESRRINFYVEPLEKLITCNPR